MTRMRLTVSLVATSLAATSFLLSPVFADLFISEVVDGDLSGGLPKFVELTNSGLAPIDLSGFSIGNYNNGGTTLGGSASTVLSGTLAPSDSYVVSYENSDSPGMGAFFDTYGFDPDNFDLGAFINGNDAIALFLADGPGTNGAATGDGSDATLVDVYGVIGVDGSGQIWDYQDSFALRNSGVNSPSATFVPSQWTFGGAAALDGLDAAGHVDNTSPGTHQFIPEPTTFVLALCGFVAWGATRRHG